MKKNLKFIAAYFMIILLVTSCKKDEPNDNGLSDKINAIVSQDIINDLQMRGMTIHTGSDPVNIESIVIASPFTLTSRFGTEDTYPLGHVIPDYKFRFYAQNADELKVEFKSANSGSGQSYTSFVAGSGNKFSLFTQISGVENGISYKNVSIISGEKTYEGIKDFQYAFVLTEKSGDEDDYKLMPVGKGRIWYDSDHMADATSVYRLFNNSAKGTMGLSGIIK